jgi:hypothetical protein
MTIDCVVQQIQSVVQHDERSARGRTYVENAEHAEGDLERDPRAEVALATGTAVGRHAWPAKDSFTLNGAVHLKL